MRITVQAVIESGDGMPSRVVPISVLERTTDHAPASGLGMLSAGGQPGSADASDCLRRRTGSRIRGVRRSMPQLQPPTRAQGREVDCLSDRLLA